MQAQKQHQQSNGHLPGALDCSSEGIWPHERSLKFPKDLYTGKPSSNLRGWATGVRLMLTFFLDIPIFLWISPNGFELRFRLPFRRTEFSIQWLTEGSVAVVFLTVKRTSKSKWSPTSVTESGAPSLHSPPVRCSLTVDWPPTSKWAVLFVTSPL